MSPEGCNSRDQNGAALGQYHDVSSSDSQCEETRDMRHEHESLLALLAIAQDRGLDFLPIRWQPALDKIGLGGSAEIRQSLINLQTSFAFKRLKSGRRQLEDEKTAFKLLITEIDILTLPAVREFQYIINLEAICWDISDTGDNLWPALVFEKSQDGDLDRFLTSQDGWSLDIHERLRLCGHVAAALHTLHSNGIIHGDVKPTNILLFRDVEGSLTAKLADFGHAAQHAGTGYIYLPQSRPFDAPEHHYRGLQYESAQKQEVYSFGMSVLWILFHNLICAATSSQHDAGHNAERLGISKGLVILQDAKDNQTLVNFAQECVENDSSIDKHQKQNLNRFFEKALSHDPRHRGLDWQMLESLFQQQFLPRRFQWEKIQVPFHRNFNIAECLPHLYQADYKVRKCLAESFMRHSGQYECQDCNQNNFANLAFCYAIGLGVELDEEKASDVAESGGISPSELNAGKEVARKATMDYTNEKINMLAKLGYLLPPDHLDDYRGRETIQDIEVEFSREIRDVAKAFGSDDAFVFHLKVILTRIMLEQGNYQRAEKVLYELREVTKNSLDYPAAISICEMLAGVYRHQGRYEESENFYNQALQAYYQVQGEAHEATQMCQDNLTGLLLDQGKYRQAEELYRKSLKTRQKLYGDTHPSTLVVMGNLAVSLSEQGQFHNAEELHRQVFEGRTKALGINHPHTLSSLANLGAMLSERGEYSESEKYFSEVLKRREDLFGHNHLETLMAVNSMAIVLHDQGRYDDAMVMLQRALEGTKVALGEEHPDTLQLLQNTATMLHDLGRYAESEDMNRQVLKLAEVVLGKNHPLMLESARSVALALIDQEKYAEAETMDLEVVRQSKGLLGNEHPDTLEAMNDLALVYSRQGRLEESEELNRQVLDAKLRTMGAIHPKTLQSYNNLAAVLTRQEKCEEAERIQLQALDGNILIHGEEHRTTLEAVCNLGSTYFIQKRYDDAEREHRRALRGYEHLLGAEHPTTLTALQNVAVVLLRKSRYLDAELMFRRALEGRICALGEDHELTLATKQSLSNALLSLGQSDAAADMMESVLQANLRKYGSENTSTLGSIHFLGTIRLYQEKYSDAVYMYRQALEGRIRLIGVQHPDTLASLEKLMTILFYLGNSEEAESVASLVFGETAGDIAMDWLITRLKEG